jgi:hypothetical protein
MGADAERRMDGREDVTKLIGAFGNRANASVEYTFCPQSAHLHILYVSHKIETGIVMLTKVSDGSLDVLN